ncbi:MAG: P-loop NTPase fold protein [Dehalococcoidia bacterium]
MANDRQDRSETEPEGKSGASISADAPIRTAAQDRLGRAPFAHRIADAILEWTSESSIVVGVYGAWGSGKSSIVNLALERMDDQAETSDLAPVVIPFNPWSYSQQNLVVSAFFDTLGSHLGRGDSTEDVRRLATGLRLYSHALAPVQFGLSLLHPAAGAFVKSARKFIEKGSGFLKEAAEAAAQDAQAIKDEISQILRKRGQLIVVVMDDIDRLSEEEIRQVFQLVKSNADFPHMVYLLAFDEKVISRALEPIYGPEFLEKIVQIQVPVPQPDHEVVIQALYGDIDALQERTGAHFTSEQFLNVFLRGPSEWMQTMRDTSRYMNALAFALPLAKDEVCVPEFMAMEALRLFRPLTYATVWAYRRFLLGQMDAIELIRRETTWFADFKAACGDEWDSVERLLEYMLPAVEEKLHVAKTHWSAAARSLWVKERRLRSEEHFHVYFGFSASPRSISQAEFDATLAHVGLGDAFTNLFERLIESAKLAPWLTRLRAHAGAIPDPEKAARALLAVGNLAATGRPFSFDANLQLAFAVCQVLEQLESEERTRTLQKAASGEGDLYTVFRCLDILEDDAKNRLRGSLNPQQLSVVRDQLLIQIRHEADTGALLDRGHLPRLMGVWMNLDDHALAGAFLQMCVSDETRLAKALEVFVADSYSGGGDSLFWSGSLRPDRVTIGLVGEEALLRGLAGLGQSEVELTERQQAIVAFLVELDKAGSILLEDDGGQSDQDGAGAEEPDEGEPSGDPRVS